jgi:hypothetical protein
MALSSIKYKYAPAKCKGLEIKFFETCWLIGKNMKFDSSNNKEVTCLKT